MSREERILDDSYYNLIVCKECDWFDPTHYLEIKYGKSWKEATFYLPTIVSESGYSLLDYYKIQFENINAYSYSENDCCPWCGSELERTAVKLVKYVAHYKHEYKSLFGKEKVSEGTSEQFRGYVKKGE